MKIAAIIRSVPDTEAKLRNIGRDINREEIEFIVNPYDEYAVEEALKLREKVNDSTVDAFCLGPQTVDKQLKWSLSVGSDEAYRISTDNWYNIRESAQAKIFSRVLKDREYDFVFIGKKAIDYDISSLPFYLGLSLNYKVMPAVVSFDYSAEDNMVSLSGLIDSIKVNKKGKPPVIICCEKGLNEPRYPSLKNIMKAKKKEINVIDVDEGDYKNFLVEIKALNIPSVKRKAEVLSGERCDIVKKVVQIISQEIKVL